MLHYQGTYVGQYKNGKRDGEGVMKSPGSSYEGSWKNDVKEGKGTNTWKNGRRCVANPPSSPALLVYTIESLYAPLTPKHAYNGPWWLSCRLTTSLLYRPRQRCPRRSPSLPNLSVMRESGRMTRYPGRGGGNGAMTGASMASSREIAL